MKGDPLSHCGLLLKDGRPCTRMNPWHVSAHEYGGIVALSIEEADPEEARVKRIKDVAEYLTRFYTDRVCRLAYGRPTLIGLTDTEAEKRIGALEQELGTLRK